MNYQRQNKNQNTLDSIQTRQYNNTPIHVPYNSNTAEITTAGLCTMPGSQNYDPKMEAKKHTTAGIRWWSPTQLLICRSEACVWQSGRDAQFSSVCGRM
ncbi:hypothetical protein DL98DRAFT_601962 [Cadophora sp. DSE1049]|nr:hypothetical protein DL98DRAFT_601962 [Cadophora sp. DSE1049]